MALCTDVCLSRCPPSDKQGNGADQSGVIAHTATSWVVPCLFSPTSAPSLVMSIVPNTMGFIIINDNYCYWRTRETSSHTDILFHASHQISFFPHTSYFSLEHRRKGRRIDWVISGFLTMGEPQNLTGLFSKNSPDLENMCLVGWGGSGNVNIENSTQEILIVP